MSDINISKNIFNAEVFAEIFPEVKKLQRLIRYIAKSQINNRRRLRETRAIMQTCFDHLLDALTQFPSLSYDQMDKNLRDVRLLGSLIKKYFPKKRTNPISCPICISTIHTLKCWNPCNHKFCAECIEKWDKNSCPICRKKDPLLVDIGVWRDEGDSLNGEEDEETYAEGRARFEMLFGRLRRGL